MTDHDPLDELASAHLDGATSPEEAARVAADPALLARVEALRAVRDAVGHVPPADPDRRDAAIAAALAAFEEAGRPDHGRTASVTSLTEVAAQRGRPVRALRWVGAAAAIALLVALVPLVSKLGGSDDEDMASQTSEDSSGDTEVTEDGAAIGGDPEAPAAEAGDDGGTTSTAILRAFVLGDYDSVDDLAAAVAPPSAPAAFSSTRYEKDIRCPADDEQEVAADLSTRSGRGLATVGGTPVEVSITTDADGARTLRVYRAADCTLIDERQL